MVLAPARQDRRIARPQKRLGLLVPSQPGQADAEVALSKAVQKSPNDSRFWYAYGEIYRLQERFDEALNAYTKAVDLEPPHPKAIAKLGILLVDRKDWKEAEAVLTKAARRDPKNPVIYLHLGVVYAATRRNKVAIETFQKFLELAPKTDPDRGRAQDAINDHAWFVGYAPAEDPKIVVAVMLEFGGHGSRAARIATRIIEMYLKVRVASMPQTEGD